MCKYLPGEKYLLYIKHTRESYMFIGILQISEKKTSSTKEVRSRASLVAQWLRICLPVQGTWVRALVQEDPTCRGATKPARRNY